MATKDMRRPDLVVPYISPQDKEESSGDVMSMVASSMPIMAMFARNKFIAWTGVVVTLQHWLAETPKTKASARQPASFSFFMSMMGLAVVCL